MLDELRLPVEASAPRSARRWWRQHEGRVPGDAGDVVELLLTEVVTNVVVHARTTSTCRLAVQDDVVCVEVQDGSPSLPRRRPRLAEHAESGRGVELLDTLAARWGVRRVPGGKVVWFCVAATG